MKRLTLLLVIAFISAFISCSDDKDTIKFKVLCTGTTNPDFTGFYIVNGGSTTNITAVQVGGSTYEFEKEIKDLDYLEVVATKSKDDSSLTIKVYRDDIRVKEASLDANYPSSDPESTLRLDYQYGEEEQSEESEETTTTTSSS